MTSRDTAGEDSRLSSSKTLKIYNPRDLLFGVSHFRHQSQAVIFPIAPSINYLRIMMSETLLWGSWDQAGEES